MRAAIVGVGLIGGSLGLAWRRRGPFDTVVGVGRHTAALRAALDLGAVDEATTDLRAGVAQADLVVLAAPVRACIELLPVVAAACKGGAVITDVASTKAAIVQAGAGSPVPFVGGHPMAGSERTGVEAASADLFRGATWVVTPTASTPAAALDLVVSAIAATEARLVRMDAEAHDRYVAAASHLPQAAAVALAASVPAAALQVAAAGYRDMTRLASSSPEVWNDIFATNRENVVAAIAAMEGSLATLRQAIAAGDEAGVRALFERAARR